MAVALDPNDSPTALFCALETALARGDFYRAAELRDRLSALGFKVSVRIPPPKTRKTTHRESPKSVAPQERER